MPIKPIVIRIVSDGAARAQSDIQAVALSVEGVGDAGKGAASGLDAASKAASSLLQSVASDFKSVGQSVPGAELLEGMTSGLGNVRGQIADVKAAMDELRNAGDGGPQGVDVGLLQKGAESAEALSGKLEGVRNAGLAVAAVGVGGIALSKSLADTAEEGNAVEARLESILKVQGRLGDLDAQNEIVQNVTVKGHFADDDEIRNGAVLLDSFSVKTEHMSELLEDAARQARTMGSEVGNVAEQLGKAYNTGEVSMLKKSGVTLSDDDVTKVQDAYARSAAEGQALFVEMVGAAIRNNSVSLEDSLTDSQKAANNAARARDDFQTNTGTGAAKARAEIAGIGGELLGIINKGPGLQQTAGYLGTYGSYALAGVGSLVALGAQLGQLFIGYQSLKAAKSLDAIATNTSTAATATNTGAQVVNAGASTANAGAASVRAGATGVASAATATNTAATEVNTAAQIRARVATMGVYAGVVLIGVAAAATVAQVAYSVGQHLGLLSQEETLLSRVAAGWERVKAAATGANVGFQANERDLKEGVEKVKADNAKAVLQGKKSQADADKDNIAQEIKLRETFAREQLRVGDTANMTKNQEEAARLRQQQAGFVAPPAPLMPSPSAAAPTVGAASDASENAIRAAEDAAAAEPDKERKKELQNQSRLMKRAASDSKRRTAAADKTAKTAKSLADKAEKVADADDLALAKANSDVDAAAEISKLEDALQDAKDDENAAEVGRITTAIALAKANKEFQDSMAAAAQEEAGKHRTTLEKIARINYEADESRALDAGAKAQRAVEKSGDKEGDKKGKRDASIRHALAVMGGSGRSILDGATTALNPGGAIADSKRFAYSGKDWNGDTIRQMDSLWNPVDLSGGYSRAVPGAGGFGADFGASENGRETNQKREFQAVQSSTTQKFNGDYHIKFDDIVIPYQGIGNLRGRF